MAIAVCILWVHSPTRPSCSQRAYLQRPLPEVASQAESFMTSTTGYIQDSVKGFLHCYTQTAHKGTFSHHSNTHSLDFSWDC